MMAPKLRTSVDTAWIRENLEKEKRREDPILPVPGDLIKAPEPFVVASLK
jgi:hypothetical protein